MNNEDTILLGSKILESTFEHSKMAVGIWPEFLCLAPLLMEIHKRKQYYLIMVIPLSLKLRGHQ